MPQPENEFNIPRSGFIITDYSDKTSLKHLQINANYFSHTQSKHESLAYTTPEKNLVSNKTQPQDLKEFSTDPMFNSEEQEANNLIESGKSETYKSRNDSRQSWVDSIRSSTSPILKKTASLNSNFTDNLSEQFRT